MLMELVWTYNEFEAAVTAAAAANGKPTDNELSLIKEFLNQYHINNTKNKRSSYLIEMLTNYNATQIGYMAQDYEYKSCSQYQIVALLYEQIKARRSEISNMKYAAKDRWAKLGTYDNVGQKILAAFNKNEAYKIRFNKKIYPSIEKILKKMETTMKGASMDAIYNNENILGVQYLNEIERDPLEIQVISGEIWSCGKGFLDIPFVLDTQQMRTDSAGDGWAIFVMDRNNKRKIYLNDHIRGKFHHSSFLSAANVVAAGEIAIHNGKVVGIVNKSGHYKPTAYMLHYFLRHLHANGVNLKGIPVWPNIDPDTRRQSPICFDAFEVMMNKTELGTSKGLTRIYSSLTINF